MQRQGSTNIALVVTVGSLAVVGLLIIGLMNLPDGSAAHNGSGEAASDNESKGGGSDETPALEVYCAAGMKNPIEAAAEQFQAETGIEVQLQYGGSGTLLSNMQIARRGDLYIAADQSYIDIAREKDLLDEAIPLARQRAVIAVRKGNPKNIRSIDDLLREDVTFGLANPEAASVGKLTQNLLEQTGQWDEVKPAATVFKATVNEIMAGVLIGSLDAAVIWNALVRQHPDELEAVHVPAFDAAPQNVTIGVLRTCDQPARALLFARYLQAPEKGERQFAQFGFETVAGDEWAQTPELTLFSGGVNRLAIRET
ncbi:MAG: molybdate ABC transporter substrate-binding protein, partial [Planctomycetaceae bacterium]